GARRAALAGDLACLDAGGAHVDPLGRAADHGTDPLDVRVPAAAGAAVRVRDVVAEARPLAAYIADGSHGSLHWLGLRDSTVPPGPLGADQAAVEAYPMLSPVREPAAA